MIWQIELVLYLLLVAAAVVSLTVRDLLTAAVSLTAYSFIVALLIACMGAVDVAFTESVVGAGIAGVLFVVAIFRTSRRSID